MKPFTFEKPKNLAQAQDLKIKEKSFLAGGTNLVDLQKKNIANPDGLIDVSEALSNDIKTKKNRLIIGAMVKNTELTLNNDLLKHSPLIAKAVLAGASPQIRNMASTGGNLLQRTRCPYFYDISAPCNKRNPGSACSAIKGDTHNMAVAGYSQQCVATHPSDLCVALAALDAEVTVANGKQESFIAFKDFHRLPGETPWLDNNLPENAVITQIEIPENRFNKNFAYLKIRERSSYAFALVSVAAALDLENGKIKEARLASGGVAHKPWRWTEAEKFLQGKSATPEIFAQAAALATSPLKPLKDNAYKIPLLKGAIESALKQALQPERSFI